MKQVSSAPAPKLKLVIINAADVLTEARDYTNRRIHELRTEIEGIERATRTHLERRKRLAHREDQTAVAEREKAAREIEEGAISITEFREHIAVAEKAIAGFSAEIAICRQPGWKLTNEHVAHAMLDWLMKLEEQHAKGPPREGAFPGVAARLHRHRDALLKAGREVLQTRK